MHAAEEKKLLPVTIISEFLGRFNDLIATSSAAVPLQIATEYLFPTYSENFFSTKLGAFARYRSPCKFAVCGYSKTSLGSHFAFRCKSNSQRAFFFYFYIGLILGVQKYNPIILDHFQNCTFLVEYEII